jgi:hypothetical protein
METSVGSVESKGKCTSGARMWTIMVTALALTTIFASKGTADCGYSESDGASVESVLPKTLSSQTRLAQSQAPSEAAPASSATSESGSARTSIVGLWHVRFSSGGQLTDQGIDAWHSDGIEVLNDTNPPHFCLGVWERTGPRSYKLNHVFWSFDSSDKLIGSGVIKETVVVDRGGQTLSGSFTVDRFDLSGNNIFHATREVTGQRITAD